MGSLFIITVPLRALEAMMRQKELNLRPVDRKSFDLIPMKFPINNLSPSGSNETASTTNGSMGESEFVAATSKGNVKVRITEDTMEVVDNLGQTFDSEPTNNKRNSTYEKTKTIENMFLEKHLEDCLVKFNIVADCWGKTGSGDYHQVTLTVSDEKTEHIIDYLLTAGIGSKYSSSLCVCSATVYYEPADDSKFLDEEEKIDSGGDESKKKANKWNEFVASIKSRLTVAQVVQSVKANAILTFDFIVLTLVAGMIAGLGLIDDSAVNVVASMLVSPLMGPIMAATFGAIIKDWQLVRIGVTNELIGLSLCLLVGYIFGILLQVPVFNGPWSDAKVWPTGQMSGRSETRALAVGVLVAIPSGAGVALSILAGNSGSLVGVAISASLLPPAVNCGIFWGLATVIGIKERVHGRSPNIDCHHNLTESYTKEYKHMYCDNTAKEYLWMGLVSFGLTLINIFVIFLVGLLILKIKEVAPHTTRQSLQRFWKTDLKVAREYNDRGEGGSTLIHDLDETGHAKEILSNIEHDQTFTSINRRTGLSPYTNIVHEVRQRKQLGSLEDIHAAHKKELTAKPSSRGWFSWMRENPSKDDGSMQTLEEGIKERSKSIRSLRPKRQ